eukprot:TRINITY_DN37156_c0_g1_i1.p1 TRINITY_DN37156_c0_g1~~TRINITY_DN37156_c0_g1_i1.p1  ORF type:complete len:489 (+),score=92.37 TRINITY_DN37156_c0_g1_i1:31-1467(+)
MADAVDPEETWTLVASAELMEELPAPRGASGRYLLLGLAAGCLAAAAAAAVALGLSRASSVTGAPSRMEFESLALDEEDALPGGVDATVYDPEELIQLPPERGTRWYAGFMTGGDAWLPALKGLVTSMKLVKAKYPFVLLVTQEPSEELKAYAQCAGFFLKQVPYVNNVLRQERIAYHKTIMRWKGTFTKLQVFRLLAKKVVYLDLDIVLLHNIDHLFDLQGVFHATSGTIPRGNYFPNTGMMVIEPSVKLYRDLIAGLHGPVPSKYLDGGDGGYLWYFFRDVWTPDNALPIKYNTLKLQEAVHRKYGKECPWNISDVWVLHVSGSHKPWSYPDTYRRGGPSNPSPESWVAWWDVYNQRHDAVSCHGAATGSSAEEQVTFKRLGVGPCHNAGGDPTPYCRSPSNGMTKAKCQVQCLSDTACVGFSMWGEGYCALHTTAADSVYENCYYQQSKLDIASSRFQMNGEGCFAKKKIQETSQ